MLKLKKFYFQFCLRFLIFQKKKHKIHLNIKIKIEIFENDH